VSIGINLPVYPEFVQVPGYPVYYAPRLNSNYFFYDGLYWVYQGDNWYASEWYNGPWALVAPEVVPLYILRIPVRYYRRPPGFFRGWRADAPPRWGQHWGNEWEQRRSGWDRWDRRSVPAPAPLPVYQRQYSGNRYPTVERQQALQSQNYRYQPRDEVVRQHYQQQRAQAAPAAPQRGPQQAAPEQRSPQREQRAAPPPSPQQGAREPLRSEPRQRADENVQRPAPTQAPPAPSQRIPQQAAPEQRRPQPEQRAAPLPPPQQGAREVPRSQPPQQQPPQAAPQREQQAPRPQGKDERPQGKGESEGKGQGKGEERGQGKGEERGQERNK
jgi:hypothetical protein